MNSFKIQIPKEMFAPAEFMQVTEFILMDKIESGPDEFIFENPVSIDAIITNTGGAFLIQGSVKGEIKTTCARCLEDAYIDINGSIEGYVLIEGEKNDLDDLEEDEFVVLSDDKTIELIQFITSAILLDLPRIPLCSDNCKGLCPKCGCNLNSQTCTCDQEESEDFSNNPFAILKDLNLN